MLDEFEVEFVRKRFVLIYLNATIITSRAEAIICASAALFQTILLVCSSFIFRKHV